jgi:hypothetical protein
MAAVNYIEKRVLMKDAKSVIKFQLLTYCYINNIQVSDSDLNCLSLLAENGTQELTHFCNMAFVDNIFSSIQSVRNCLNKANKKNLVIKEGKNRKVVYLNPNLGIVVFKGNENILLDYKLLYVATKES